MAREAAVSDTDNRMKTPIFLVSLALAGLGLSSCGTMEKPPKPGRVVDTPFLGTPLPVVLDETVGLTDNNATNVVTGRVRNELRNGIKKSIAAQGVFALTGAEPATGPQPARISATVLEVRVRDGIGIHTVVYNKVTEYVDARVEVKLTQPNSPVVIHVGASHLKKEIRGGLVDINPEATAPGFKDWSDGEQWASVACKLALENACADLARAIEKERSSLASVALKPGG